MARNGKAAAKAKTKNAMPFSELSDDNREWLKSYEERGWLASYDADGYSATKTFAVNEEPVTVGPCDAFMVMMNLVEKAENERNGTAEAVASGTDPNPMGKLPGMEEPEIDELNLQADNCIAALEKRKQATTASKDQDDIMRQMMHKFDRKRYSRHGWSIVIEDSEKLVIKKAEQAPPKNPKPVRIKKGGDLLK